MRWVGTEKQCLQEESQYEGLPCWNRRMKSQRRMTKELVQGERKMAD